MRQVDYERFLCGLAFESWKERAAQARAKVLAGGRPQNFNSSIWKDLKQMLIDGNHDKCMYCEGQYVAGSHDDAEHYRPKGEVTAWDQYTGRRELVDHPGYFWLAYEWQNILLACTKCNSPHPDGDGGQSHSGKLNEFPLTAGRARCQSPGPDPEHWWEELKAEEPLLLHPYFDHCQDHFRAGVDGVIYGITAQGRATVQTCDLNRPKLRTARARAEEQVRLRASFVCNQHLARRPIDTLTIKPEEQFSVYLSDRLFRYVEELILVATGRRVILRS